MADAPRAGEFELIARHFAPLAAGQAGALGLADDAALLRLPRGHELVVTADAMVAGVHFLDDDPPPLIARKLLRVNLSDLAAMGARALGYLLTAAWPEATAEDWIAAFAAGLGEDQRAFGVGLLGGDTVSTPGPLCLSLTALGCVPAGRALRRNGARAGDALFVSGTVGDAALGLRLLKGEIALADAAARELVDRYRLPRPRTTLGPRLLGLASAAIDVSDGLVADLAHLAETSGVGCRLEAAAVPLSAPARAALEAEPALLEPILTGGDDYELLFSAPDGAAPALADLARQLDLPLSQIGRVTAGAGVEVVDVAGQPLRLARAGWTHF